MTRTTVAAAIFSATVTIAGGAIFSPSPSSQLDSAVLTIDACVSINVTSIDDHFIADLVNRGWTPRDDDGMEALYAPTCIR